MALVELADAPCEVAHPSMVGHRTRMQTLLLSVTVIVLNGLVLWLLTRMALMSWADLTFVLPVTSIGYVLSAVLGCVFLHEVVSIERWAGTFLIFVGAMLVGATTHHRTPDVPEEMR